MAIVAIEAGTELKSCPLCGCEAVLKTQGISKMGTSSATPIYWVKCTNSNCGISPAALENQSAAIDLWNRRY